MQELEPQIRRLFSAFSYRKISYHYGQKEILLQFDYPDAQDQNAFGEAAKEFTLATGWSVELAPSMNHSAASFLLTSLLGERILKISYYQERRCYQVSLSGKPDPVQEKAAAEQFRAATGWTLLLSGTAAEGLGSQKFESSDFFSPSDPSMEALEQNMALFCVDQSFEECPHRPGKKSLKQDGEGSYLELSFVSPELGRTYGETLQALADQTGWRIRISDKVNQNELFRIAQLLCMKEEIVLLKHPSYLPDQRKLQMKVSDGETSEKLERIKEELQRLTGLTCVLIRSAR